eukprot:gene2961-4971_t
MVCGSGVPNIILIIVLAASPIAALILSVICLIVFQSPSDSSSPTNDLTTRIYNIACSTILSRVVFVLTLSMVILLPLMLPFDSANVTMAGCLDLALPIIWQVIFTFVAFWIVFVIPFSISFYEAQRTYDACWKGFLRQCLCGLGFTVPVVIVFVIITGASYYFLGIAEINLISYSSETHYTSLQLATANVATCTNCSIADTNVLIRMSIFVYIIALLCIVGWLVFLVFGGMGITSLPINFIAHAFMTRIRPISLETKEECDRIMLAWSSNIINRGQKLNEEMKRAFPTFKTRAAYREFVEEYDQLQDDYKVVRKQFSVKPTSFCIIPAYLAIAIFSWIMFAVWCIHIILDMITDPPIYPFLNNFLDLLNQIFPMVSWGFYSFMAYYLLIVTFYGFYRTTSNIPFFNFYPMGIRSTMANGLLVNSGILLVATVAICQFLSNAFSSYIRYSAIDSMFNTYIGNMIYLKYFFKYVHYVFLGFMVIGFFLAGIELVYRLFLKKPLYSLIRNIFFKEEVVKENFHGKLMEAMKKNSGWGNGKKDE